MCAHPDLRMPNALPTPGQEEQWFAEMAESLAARYGLGSISGASRAWLRLRQWKPVPVATLSQVSFVRDFLVEQAKRGPTVAHGLMNALKFIRDHLQVQLPLDESRLM